MKVLWVCNIPIPQIAKDMGLEIPNICGWITGFANWIGQKMDIDLHICFPILGSKEITRGITGKIKYYSFSQPRALKILPAEDQLHSSRRMKKHLRAIIQEVSPDILHVFGTEYPHSLVAIEEYNRPERTVLNIQGLTSYYWMHFNSGIPYKEAKKFTISNLVRGNLLRQAQKIYQRGIFETVAIKKSGHVIGRTDWDLACSIQTNTDVKYHFCNETLRESFYSGLWDYSKCEKHSIFMSQAATPIKGLHFMLRAMPEILRVYPDTHLYIAGNNILEKSTIKHKLKMSPYARFASRLIKEYDLQNHVTFTGKLSEREMKNRFLKCNVFVSPSTVENESNSISEAKMLAVPVVASYVGGVTNRIIHGVDGYLYQHDAPYMLSLFVKKVFESGADVARMGIQGQVNASKLHDPEKNGERLMKIYEDINNG